VSPRWALALWLLGGCAHARLVPVPATVALVERPGWHALTAEHRVRVTVRVDGRTDQRSLRGLIAVERPDRLRLRALGPAGITLFDLLVRTGHAKVLSAIRGPSDSTSGRALGDVITSLAADLSCAYALEPGVGRSVRLDGNAVLVEEPGRRVRLSRFAGSPPTWRRAEIAAGNYFVLVEVDQVTADPSLDPTMFAD
jgi:hypothetical protein